MDSSHIMQWKASITYNNKMNSSQGIVF